MLTPWWPGMSLAAISCTALLWHRSRPRVTTTITILCVMGMAVLGYVLTVLLLARSWPRSTHWPPAPTRGPNASSPSPPSSRWWARHCSPARQGAGGPQDDRPHRLAAPAGRPRLRDQAAASLSGGRAARAEYAERTREEEARHRVAEERVRIARELHDVVAHHLALANAQAGTVAHLMRTHPDQAEKIVNELTGTTSSALREMKAVVGLLRQADDPEAPLEPAPGLDRLSDLAASFASAVSRSPSSRGTAATALSRGGPHRLRIVQEARR